MSRKYLDDERQSVYLFLAIWIVYAVLNMTKNCYSGAMAAIVSEGILTKSQTGAISAMFYVVYTICQLAGGFLVEKYSASKLVLIGILGAVLANVVIYFNQNYMVMMVTWCLNGAIQSATYPGLFKILSTQLHPAHRHNAVFYFSLTASGGYFASYLCAALVSKWQSNFLISAILLLLMALYWFFTYRTSEEKMILHELTEVGREAREEKKNIGTFKLILISGLPLIWIVILVQTFFNQGIKGVTSVMLMESYGHVSASFATGLNTVMIAVGAVGIFLARKFLLSRIKNESTAMTILFLLTIPALAVLMFVGKWPLAVLLVSLSLISLFVTAAYMLNSYIVARFAPYGCVGIISGIVNGAPALGICISNYAFPKMAEGLGWLMTTKIWFIIGVVALALSLISIPLWKKMIPSR